jgi:hypothetical protein
MGQNPSSFFTALMEKMGFTALQCVEFNIKIIDLALSAA